jgi:hypothetical protein
MVRTYEAEITWSVEGGASGTITLRRGFLSAVDAQRGARKYVAREGVLGSVVIRTTEAS